MYKGKKIIAIIPARSGSKGLKDKNIKLFKGKPLIAHTIEAALQSEIFHNVIVSTDSQTYADISKRYGANVPFLRSKELSGDKASSSDVIINVLRTLEESGESFDYFILLQPTSPLRDSKDIRAAVDLLFSKNATSVVSVCEVDHSPLLSNVLKEDLKLKDFIKNTNNTRRQDMEKYFRINGAIYISKTEHYIENKDFYGEDSFAYIMDKEKSIDIDDIVDFSIAEVMYDYVKQKI